MFWILVWLQIQAYLSKKSIISELWHFAWIDHQKKDSNLGSSETLACVEMEQKCKYWKVAKTTFKAFQNVLESLKCEGRMPWKITENILENIATWLFKR